MQSQRSLTDVPSRLVHGTYVKKIRTNARDQGFYPQQSLPPQISLLVLRNSLWSRRSLMSPISLPASCSGSSVSRRLFHTTPCSPVSPRSCSLFLLFLLLVQLVPCGCAASASHISTLLLSAGTTLQIFPSVFSKGGWKTHLRSQLPLCYLFLRLGSVSFPPCLSVFKNQVITMRC